MELSGKWTVSHFPYATLGIVEITVREGKNRTAISQHDIVAFSRKWLDRNGVALPDIIFFVEEIEECKGYERWGS